MAGGKTFEQSSEDQVASLKEKWTLVNGELRKKGDQVNTALQRVAESKGVDLNNITDEQNRQAFFNYFHGEAQKAVSQAGANIDPGVINSWANLMAESQMTQAQRMGFYQPHGIAFGQGQGRTLAQSPGFLPGFYSGVEHAIVTGKQERASGDQWLATLKNAQTVKPDEMKALGLEDWLKGQGKVSRKDLLDYVRANSLEMEEVQKGKDISTDKLLPMGREGYDPNEVEYGHVVLPGTDRETYHETLFTLPGHEPVYQDPHWPTHPNVVGHVRFDVPEVDGKKEVRIQEMQAGWHEEGSKKGYLDPAVWRQRKEEYERAEREVSKAADKVREFNTPNQDALRKAFIAQREGRLEQSDLIDKYYELGEKHDKAVNDYIRAKDAFEHIRNINVPDAPFKTSWPELILKRMLRYAAENGIEKVSWPGDAKTVAKVEGWPDPKQVPANPNRYKIVSLDDYRYLISQGTHADDYSGIPDRNLAGQRFTKQEAENRLGALNAAKWVIDHGGGHKWDGTAIIDRYLKDLPKIAEKLGKKYGVKVENEIGDQPSGKYRLEVDPRYHTRENSFEIVDETGKAVEYYNTREEAEADLKRRNEAKFNSINLSKDFQSSILEKGFPLYQGGSRPLARVTITPDGSQKLLEVFKRANESSLFHESGHIFLEQLAKDAAHEKAPKQIKDDFATSLKELGATREQWDSWQKPNLSPEEDKAFTEFHERFARAFEQYGLSGKAPSAGLVRVFEMMKEWLTHIYGQFVRQGEEFPEALQGVFDRLLATDKEIQEYRSGESRAAPTLFDIHSGLAREASPEEARPLATKINAERLSAQPPRRISDEISKAEGDLSGTAGERSEGLRELDAGGNQAGNEPGGNNVGAGGGQVGAGRSKPVTESSSRKGESQSNPLAPTATRTYPRGTGSRFVDASGNFSLKDVRNFDDLKELWGDMKDGENVADGPATPGMLIDLGGAMGRNGLTNRLGLNAKDIAKAQALLGQASIDVVTARKALAESPTNVNKDHPEFGRIANNALEYEKALQRMKMFLGYYADARKEWGRAGHALQALYKHWSAEEVQNIEAMTGRSFNQLLTEAKLGTGMSDQFKNAKWVRDLRKPLWGRMISELFTNDILAGIATHVTYFLDTLNRAVQKTALDVPMASLIGAVRQHFNPDRARVYSSESVARVMEYYRSAPKAVQSALDSLSSAQQVRAPGEPITPLSGAWRKLTRAEMKSPPPGQYLTDDDLAKSIAQNDVRWQEVGSHLFGMIRGIKDAFISHGEVLAAGGTPKFSISRTQTGYIPNFNAQVGDTRLSFPAGSIIRTPTRVVAGLHSLQFTANYSVEINSWAWREAIREGYTPYSEAHTNKVAELRQNPSLAAMQHASTAAYGLSLLDEGGELTKRLSYLFNLAPELPFLGETPILKFIDPFIKITANIFKQSVMARTPLGLLAPSIRREILGEHFHPEDTPGHPKDTPEEKRLKQVDQDVAQARMIVGSLASMFFGGLAYEGWLTGAGPTDPKKRAVWEAAGYKSHTVQIGDLNYSIARLGSFGMLASTAADLYQVAHIAHEEDMHHASLHLAHAFVQNMVDESFFRGIADLAQAIEDPKQHGQRWVNDFVPAFIPGEAFFNQANHAIDPYTRNARTVTDAIMAKLPWESQQLMPRRDIWGEPIRQPDALLGKGITAIYEYQVSRDPVNIALKQLDVGISQVPRTIRNVKLSDQEYDDFQRFSGRLLKQRLNAFVTSAYWNQLDPNMKRQTVQEFVKQSRNVAREIMLGRYHHITADATRLRAHRFDAEED